MSKENKDGKEKNGNLDEELISIDWEEEVVPEFMNTVGKEVTDLEEGEVVIPKESDITVTDFEEEEEEEPTKGKATTKESNKSTDKAGKKDEEPDDEEEEIKDKETKSPPSKGTKVSSPALVFAKFLNEKGVISLEEEDTNKLQEILQEEGEEAAFEFIFNREVESRVEQIKNVYEDDVKEYISLRDFGVAPDKAAQLVKNKNLLEQIGERDVSESSNEALRKDLIRQYLKSTTKMSDEDIEDQIETLVDTGKDVTWATKSLKYLKEQSKQMIEEEKARIKQEEEQAKARAKEVRDLVTKTVMESSTILGQEVSSAMKSKVVKLLLEPAGEDPNGNPIDGVTAWLLKDPLKNRINLAYAIASGILDGKLTSIKKKVKSQVIDELEQSIYERNNSLGGSAAKYNQSDAMKALKEMFPDDDNTF